MSEDQQLTKQIKSFYEKYHQKRNRPLDSWLTDVYWSELFGTVLEVGAGTRPLESNPNVRTYVPIDLAFQALLKAKERNLHGVVADATQIPFKDQSFDVSCCYDVVEHIINPETLLSEMCRVSGDKVIISGPNYIGKVYCPSLDRYILRNVALYFQGKHRQWYRLEDFHLEYDSDWKPDFDAVTATNSQWIKQQLKKHNFRITAFTTWKRDIPKLSAVLERIPVIRELGPYMHIVAERI